MVLANYIANFPRRLRGSLLLVLACGAIQSAQAASPTLTDAFANRSLLTDDTGRVDGSNVGAGLEAGEPQHGGKPGGRSVWISWLAPSDGVATFWSDGSSFDTLMSAYYFSQPADTTLDKLREAARNDDDPTRLPTQTSLIQFGARAGVRYEIALDGYRGASGDIRLRWDFLSATSPPPVVVSVPDDRAARQGDTVTFTVNMQTSPNLRLQWRLNGNSFGAEGTTLVITDLQPVNLGRYTLRIDLGDVRFETTPIELQINSEGQTNALARDKLFDAFASSLRPEDDHGGGGGGGAGGQATLASVGVSRGYNGTQIFNTAYSTPDPTEPDHCGQAGGATYWYAYQPPADGTLILDTIGSSYDTFIAVYTYNPPFTSYADLIPIACDNDSAATNGAARVELAAPKARQFLIVVDGVNATRGIVHLNYQLDTSRLPMPPTLLNPPAVRTVPDGGALSLRPDVMGSPPLYFTWWKGTTLLADATNSVLELTHLVRENSGNYSVTISNYVGAPLNIIMSVNVLVPPRIQFTPHLDPPATLSFLSVVGQRYVLEQTDALDHPWQPLSDPMLGDGSVIVITNDMPIGNKFFRIRVE